MNRIDFMNFDMGTLDHRLLLLDKIKKYAPFDTLVDIGCGDGADLYLIGDAMPEVKLTGVDEDIGNAQKYTRAHLFRRDIREWIKEVPDSTYDIVLSNGVLMYLPFEILKDYIRIAKKAVILSERDKYKHINPSFNDYFASIGVSALSTKITKEIRHSWANDGYIYEIVI